jgi:hypothetical protein
MVLPTRLGNNSTVDKSPLTLIVVADGLLSRESSDTRPRSSAHEIPVSLVVSEFLERQSVIPVSIFMPLALVPVPPASDSVVTTFALSLQFGTSGLRLWTVLAVLSDGQRKLMLSFFDSVLTFRSVVIRSNSGKASQCQY